jgi:hypothetical protein
MIRQPGQRWARRWRPCRAHNEPLKQIRLGLFGHCRCPPVVAAGNVSRGKRSTCQSTCTRRPMCPEDAQGRTESRSRGSRPTTERGAPVVTTQSMAAGSLLARCNSSWGGAARSAGAAVGVSRQVVRVVGGRVCRFATIRVQARLLVLETGLGPGRLDFASIPPRDAGDKPGSCLAKSRGSPRTAVAPGFVVLRVLCRA